MRGFKCFLNLLRRSTKSFALLCNAFATSGPLMTLIGIGFVFLQSFDFPPSYDQLFQIASPEIWGSVSLILGFLGYLGLAVGDRQLWRVAHGFGFVLFCSLSIGFLPAFQWPLWDWIHSTGSWTGATTYAALAANAWVRMRGTYKEPEW